jgi:hypothetical protein
MSRDAKQEPWRNMTNEQAAKLCDDLVALLSDDSLAPMTPGEVTEELHEAGYTDDQIVQMGQHFASLASGLLAALDGKEAK